MFTTILKKSIATAAAVGSVLAVTSIAAPASVTASPEVKTVAATCYPDSVATATDVKLSRTIGQYGSVNPVSVRVSSGAGTPTGTVTVTLSGGGVHETYTLPLSGGNGHHNLPRTLAAGVTYAVHATYKASGCFSSSADDIHYTVVKSRSSVAGIHARNVRRGGHPAVTGRVVPATGAPIFGRVTVVLLHRGHVVDSQRVILHRGSFAAAFPAVRPLGRWSAVAYYRGSAGFNPSTGSTTFRVTR